MFKKFLTSVLAVCLLLGTMNTVAFADTTPPEIKPIEKIRMVDASIQTGGAREYYIEPLETAKVIDGLTIDGAEKTMTTNPHFNFGSEGVNQFYLDKGNGKFNVADENKREGEVFVFKAGDKVVGTFIYSKALSSFELAGVQEAKDKLQTYIDSITMDVLDLEGINTESNKAAIKAFKDEVEKGKELLVKENSQLTSEELKTIQDMPSYMENGKKKKGTLSKLAHGILADFEVQGERTVKDTHTGKLYTSVDPKTGIIKVKSAIQGLEKNGNKRLYLNYVKKADFDGYVSPDATSTATPKYKKDTYPLEKYTLSERGADGVYTITVQDISEDVKILKPVLKVQLADLTYVENGDMVFVKEPMNPGGGINIPLIVNPNKPSDKEKEEAEKLAAQRSEIENAIEGLELRVSTTYTSKKNVKAKVKVVKGKIDLDKVKAYGYTVGYRYYRAAGKSSNYEERFVKEATTYYNTVGVKSTKYYYKARLVIKDKDGKVVGQTLLRQCRHGRRIWAK